MSDRIENLDEWLNFQLICKPEQSGKTFLMIQQIILDISYPIEDKKIINIILCDNNLLLTKQTSARVEADLEPYYIHNGIPYIELSSHSRTEYHNVDQVFMAIVSDGVNNIICCTNGTRINNIEKLIDKINKSPLLAGKFHFNIWLDEADKFIKFIDKTFIKIVKTHKNINVKLITATPRSLFQRYKYMNVLPIEITTSELYHGWEDNNIRIIDMPCDCLSFIVHVLTNVAQDNIIPGTIWLAPGLTTKKSHNDIKNIGVEKKMAVLCVNGDGIILTLPDTLEQITYKKDDELNNKLQEIYIKHELQRFPLVITGYICIGRGITIMSNDFMIDYAILSHYSNKDEASQLAGRMKGNIKGFENYKPPTIFTTQNFNDIAIEWEHKSTALARLAFEKEQNGDTTIITDSEFKTCSEPYTYICHPELFSSFNEAKTFLKTKEKEMRCTVRITPNNAIHICEGYSVTSKLIRGRDRDVNSLTKEDRITLEKSKQISPSTCISSTTKGSRYLILPIYENEESPPEDVKFQVRYIKFDIIEEEA